MLTTNHHQLDKIVCCIFRFVKEYTGSDSKECLRGGKFFSADLKRQKSLEQADNAMKLSVDERLNLVLPHKELSEDEDKEETMDFDGTQKKNNHFWINN